jgi:hypothetical protein
MYEVILENYYGEKTNSTINTESIDEVLKEIKVLLNHFRVIKIKKKLVESMDDS